jgi:hypothetical protein
MHSSAYASSTKTVHGLPEVAAWSRSHKFPIAYGEALDKQVLIQGRCYWSVSVYANRPERLELWHVLYVEAIGKRILIQDAVSGQAISLQKWRSKRARM